jgi:transposase
LGVFLRRKKNKSGTSSIQIIDKSSGHYRVVKTIGSSSDEDKLGALWRKGQELLEDLVGQLRLDILSTEDQTILSFFNQTDSINVRVVGPEQILGSVFNSIGYNAIEDELFRHLVISRLAYPGSKLRTIDYLRRYQGVDLQVDRLYRFLDKLNDQHKETAEHISFEHTKKVLKGNINVVFYDMTTLYFEASSEDDLRRTGFSKDGKPQHPQIMLGLLVARQGYPIGYEIFEGNTFEGHTLIPVLASFEQKFNLSRPIVVADAGLLSNNNIQLLVEAGYQYILGARIKNEKPQIKEHILSLNLGEGMCTSIKKGDGSSLIISYTASRARKDRFNRERGLKRLEKALATGKLNKSHINNRGYNKYLELTGSILVKIDYQKFEDDAKWDGLKGYITNVTLKPQALIDHYRNLWHIEKAFRISKTDLKIRPVYHRLRHRIEAHISIAFVAYSIYKELERVLKKNKVPFSAKRAIELTQTMYALDFTLPDSKRKRTINITMDENQKLLLDIFEIND